MGTRAIRTLLTAAALLAAGPAPRAAASFYFTPDIPVTPTGVNILASEIALFNGAYGIQSSHPAGTLLDGVHRMSNGSWLISVESPTLLGGATFQPSDVILYDGTQYVSFYSGALNGLPEDTNIDALFLDGGDAGNLIVSFDVPTTLGGTTFDPADLVDLSGALPSLFFDASAATPPIPVASNVTGADARAGLVYLTFDVPTTLGAVTYLPGDVVTWNGASFALHHRDAGWISGFFHGLALPASPGNVSNLTVFLAEATSELILSWSATCAPVGQDYGIYQGTIGNWTSHVAIDCTDDGGDRTEAIPVAAGMRYYLVVPHSDAAVGSFGSDSAGVERPAGAVTCAPVQVLGPTCP